MNTKLLILAFAVISAVIASQAGDGILGCTGHESKFTLSDQQPHLEQHIKNGKKYTYNYDSRKFYVVSVRGTAF